ncbi:MAG: hypothetical protein IBX40_04830 [Methanosarcinales archaeon]|nr:hypothetical protein [Methanosarcinales archaeon]
METVKIESAIEEIESEKESTFSFPVGFSYNEVNIFGKHDGVCFQNGIPHFLFEIKSTNGNINIVYPSEKIQAYLYALALEYMGFNTSQLQIIIIKAKQNMSVEDLKGCIEPIIFYLKEGTINEFNIVFPRVKIYQFDFSTHFPQVNLKSESFS